MRSISERAPIDVSTVVSVVTNRNKNTRERNETMDCGLKLPPTTFKLANFCGVRLIFPALGHPL